MENYSLSGAFMKNKTILLVEDDRSISLTETKQLQKYGYLVIQAFSGQMAVDLMFGGQKIDLILMDIDLGSNMMDGTEAAEIILKSHDLPIVFLSSHTEQEIVEKTERITSYGYVVKSSHITVLDASLKMAFRLFDAHKKLQESEERYKQIFDNTSDCIFILDVTPEQSCTIAALNPPEEKLVGRLEDMQDKDIRYCVTPELYEHIKHQYDQCIENRAVLSYEETVYGEHFYTQLIPLMDKKGNIYRIVGIARNVTEIKKLTMQLSA